MSLDQQQAWKINAVNSWQWEANHLRRDGQHWIGMDVIQKWKGRHNRETHAGEVVDSVCVFVCGKSTTMTGPVKYQYLISRSGDIVFSLTVGTLAYFVNERENPRAKNGKTLWELINRRRQRTIDEREQRRSGGSS
ncbi:hypothetical protein EC973_008760 [Apophysomyces ossiformis]|uniref:Uncharacterized protein n=1 Tax=Apophysomyces ossiformis TaxID=679940 RepID=A0A8H7BS12_9FUNG|nr:hypothetical protein EC973_008760 [Apophysomyces ossiformis]